MSKPIKLSVIIPTYKRVRHTLQTIKALGQSTGLGSDFELSVFVVDDSPDKSLEKAVQRNWPFQLTYKRVAARTPVGKKRNLGSKLTADHLLLFLDSDIEVRPDAIANAINAMRTEPRAGMINFQVLFSRPVENLTVDRPRKEDRTYLDGETVFLEVNFGRLLMLYRGAFLDTGQYDYDLFPNRGEGTDFSTRFWRAGYPIVYEPKAIVTHHVEAPDSLTRGGKGKQPVYASWMPMLLKYNVDPAKAPYLMDAIPFSPAKYFPPEDIFLGAYEGTKFVLERVAIIKKARKELPRRYPFSPLETFSYMSEVKDCIKSAEKRIAPYYRRVFG